MDRSIPGVRIEVDGALCTASGVCVNTAPGLFALPDGAYCALVITPQTRDPAAIALAQEAAAFCPTGAIAVIAEPG
jgi:ferredoxin